MERPSARETYALLLDEPSRSSRLLRWGAVVLSNLALEGGGAANPGGRRAVVVERTTGRRLLERTETVDDDASGEFATLIADFEALTDEEFRSTWIEPHVDESDS